MSAENLAAIGQRGGQYPVVDAKEVAELGRLKDRDLAEAAEERCSKYMQLTKAEALFRELRAIDSAVVSSTGTERQGLRDGGVLGYALCVSLKHHSSATRRLCRDHRPSEVNNGLPLSSMKALDLLSSLQNADIVPLPTGAR